MLELKLPVTSRASRTTSRTPQGRSLKPQGNAVRVDRSGSAARGDSQRYVFSSGDAPDDTASAASYRSAAHADARGQRSPAMHSIPTVSYGSRRTTVPSSGPSRFVRSSSGAAVTRAEAATRTATPSVAPARISTPTFADRLVRSEARLVATAVASTSVCCFLLIGYLAAYANVTRLGIEQAHVTRDFKVAQQRNQLLRAQLAAARSASYIAVAAQRQGMVMADGRACYLTPQGQAQQTMGIQVASNGTGNGEQPANIGH